MYSRFSKIFNVNYGTQQGMEKGAYHTYTDDTKFMINDDSYYKKNLENNYSKLFESQFFSKIKTPEQTKVVQNTIANESR
jgi:hypothetical protein